MSNFNFGIPKATTAAPVPATGSTTTGFGSTFAFPKTTTTNVITSITSTPTTAAVPTGFTMPTVTSAAVTAPAATTSTPALPTFSFPLQTSTNLVTKTGFSLPSQTTTGTTSVTNLTPKIDGNKTTFNLPASTSTPSSTGFSLTSAPSSTTTGLGPPVPPPESITYNEVEDLLNKWTTELAEQERLFMTQIRQVNEWEKVLLENGTKLLKLNHTVEKIQLLQKKMNLDLDFTLSQQNDFLTILEPIEKEYSSYNNNYPDVQRERMYQAAENIDAQIKKMSEDVKETIEHVNETARSQEKMHPIVLIGRILNAHMNSLQWIDENSAQLQSQIDSMTKYLDNLKRETERTYKPFQ